jgi:hypothetical protein
MEKCKTRQGLPNACPFADCARITGYPEVIQHARSRRLADNTEVGTCGQAFDIFVLLSYCIHPS